MQQTASRSIPLSVASRCTEKRQTTHRRRFSVGAWTTDIDGSDRRDSDRSLTSQMPASHAARRPPMSLDAVQPTRRRCPIARSWHEVVTNRCVDASLIGDARARDRACVVVIVGRMRARCVRIDARAFARCPPRRATVAEARSPRVARDVCATWANGVFVSRKRTVHAGLGETHRNVASACRGCLARCAWYRARSSRGAPAR